MTAKPRPSSSRTCIAEGTRWVANPAELTAARSAGFPLSLRQLRDSGPGSTAVLQEPLASPCDWVLSLALSYSACQAGPKRNEDPMNGCQIGTKYPILHAKQDPSEKRILCMAAKQGPNALFCMPNRTQVYPIGSSAWVWSLALSTSLPLCLPSTASSSACWTLRIWQTRRREAPKLG
jgi:hypothetical protein